jgi:hypothetical protein
MSVVQAKQTSTMRDALRCTYNWCSGILNAFFVTCGDLVRFFFAASFAATGQPCQLPMRHKLQQIASKKYASALQQDTLRQQKQQLCNKEKGNEVTAAQPPIAGWLVAQHNNFQSDNWNENASCRRVH